MKACSQNDGKPAKEFKHPITGRIATVGARLHDALHVWRQLGVGEKKEAGRSGEAETVDLLKRCVVVYQCEAQDQECRRIIQMP
jgi:hypothetical protein